MSHNHSHGGCSDECHDHDIPESEGPRDNLYTRIDRDNTVAMNAENGSGPEIIKPWHERMNEDIVSIGICVAASHSVTFAPVPRLGRRRPDVRCMCELCVKVSNMLLLGLYVYHSLAP